MAARRSELTGRVVAVTFASPEESARFAATLHCPFPVLADPERRAYRVLGLGRGSVARVWLHPRVWLNELRLLRRGLRHTGPPPQDARQLGGDVVLDSEGRLAWIHRGRGPEDRPSVEDVLGALAEASAPRARAT